MIPPPLCTIPDEQPIAGSPPQEFREVSEQTFASCHSPPSDFALHENAPSSAPVRASKRKRVEAQPIEKPLVQAQPIHLVRATRTLPTVRAACASQVVGATCAMPQPHARALTVAHSSQRACTIAQAHPPVCAHVRASAVVPPPQPPVSASRSPAGACPTVVCACPRAVCASAVEPSQSKHKFLPARAAHLTKAMRASEPTTGTVDRQLDVPQPSHTVQASCVTTSAQLAQPVHAIPVQRLIAPAVVRPTTVRGTQLAMAVPVRATRLPATPLTAEVVQPSTSPVRATSVVARGPMVESTLPPSSPPVSCAATLSTTADAPLPTPVQAIVLSSPAKPPHRPPLCAHPAEACSGRVRAADCLNQEDHLPEGPQAREPPVEISNGSEAVPVMLVGGGTAPQCRYIPCNESSDNRLEQAQLEGCQCKGDCSTTEGCTCLRSASCAYDGSGRLRVLLGEASPAPMIVECSKECGCTELCGNKVVSRGITIRLHLFETADRGWALRTTQSICRASFVCEYAGELISTEEAVRRRRSREGASNYIMTLREHLPDGRIMRTNIDPTEAGNAGRFINHSCEPNLRAFVVRVGSFVPRVALFAVRDIEQGEELTMFYGDGSASEGAVSAKGNRPCLCGAARCRGFLPCDDDQEEDGVFESATLLNSKS
ncbi:MAG: hypothetical protein SGPRY_000043 [Prymnesium sp.]